MTPWALVIGLMRYVFVAASWLLPWLRGRCRRGTRRRSWPRLQGIVLVVAAGTFLAPLAATSLVVAALAALLWSFGKSVTWLWRARLIRPGRPARP